MMLVNHEMRNLTYHDSSGSFAFFLFCIFEKMGFVVFFPLH